jgi:hypothetical protein
MLLSRPPPARSSIAHPLPHSPYSPPKSQLADIVPERPASWGRAVWIQLPLLAVMVLLAFLEREALVPSLAGWGIWLGLVLSAVCLYFPVRALNNLSEAAPSWRWDAFYYSTVALCIGGVVLEDSNLVVAGAAPTFFLNGILGVLALITEKRRNVHVHVSGRRYLFRRDDVR